MAGWMTVTELLERRGKWQAALDALATGVKSYAIGSRTLTRYDIKEIRDMLADIDRNLDELARGRKRGSRLIPFDG